MAKTIYLAGRKAQQLPMLACVFLSCLYMSCSQPTPNATSAPQVAGAPALAPLNSEQLVCVSAPNADAVDASLRRYEKQNGKWQAVGEPWAVVLGRTGLAWGQSLGDKIPAGALRKKEGDGKSPSGIYRLSKVFGYAEQAPDVFMPYLSVTPAWVCVDDVKSRFYNAVIDGSKVEGKDWKSAETMRRNDEMYRWGIVVEHNTSPTLPGEGSCIFMHIWRGPGEGTAGCTAMPEADILKLIQWLDQGKNPMLVQGTPEDFAYMKAHFDLP